MKKHISIFCSILFSVFLLAGCFGGSRTNEENSPAAVAASKMEQEASVKSETQKLNTAGNGKKLRVEEAKAYTDKEHVAFYINTFAKLPHNYITKEQAKKLGWQTKGTLDKVAPGKSIGGDRYGNYEKILPDKNGRTWRECDIDYVKGSRNEKRIVFSNDGLIYYTKDHYKSFEKLY